MSEDYKKIALEDVKKGQRIRVVERHSAHTVTYEGVVLAASAERGAVHLGTQEDWDGFYAGPQYDTSILLLEDAPKPKVVRTETVTITHYDDGTKTETPVKDVRVPTVIETMEQFEDYEDYLKQVVIRDSIGDYWTYRDGYWCFQSPTFSFTDDWTTTEGTAYIEANLPLTVVETVGD